MAAEKSTKSAAAPFEGNHSIAELAEVGFPGPAGAVNTTGGIRRDWLYGALASLLSAVLYVVSFPPFGVAECAYVFAIPLLLWLMAKRRPWKQVALISLAWGMLSWLALIVWLRHVTYGGYFVVSAIMALYFTTWFLAAGWALPQLRHAGAAARLAGITGMAALWVVHEYARGFFLTGFPWLPLAASHWERPLVLQVAAWTGSYGVSFLLIFFNLGLAFYIDRFVRPAPEGGPRWRFSPELFVSLAVVLGGSFGAFSAARSAAGQREPLFDVALIQPYIPQHAKWDPEKAGEILGIIERTTLLTKHLPNEPDFVLWPEAVTPLAIVGDGWTQRWVEGIAQKMEAPLLAGTIGVEESAEGGEFRWFNGAVAVDPEAGLLPSPYRKRKLVPFGEYIPFGRLFSWISKFVPLEGSFMAGESAAPLMVTVNGTPCSVGALICYEDVFPALARETVREGAEVLAVVTNNGWYGEEGMPYQHAAHSVLRAVETRRPVIRSGNGGWSGWIDEYGVIRHVLFDERGSVFFRGGEVVEVTRDEAWAGQQTFYVRHGDWFAGVCAILAAGGLACARRCRNSR